MTLTATAITQNDRSTLTFCIAASTYSAAQPLTVGNDFLPYSASFAVAAGTNITASFAINLATLSGQYGAGFGEFGISLS